VARVGDEVTMPGGILRVVAMKGRRVDRLALTLEAEPAELPPAES